MTRVMALVGSGRALDIALGLGQVSAVALVPEDQEAALGAARAAGALRAVAVWDEALRETDYYGAAQALACVARRLSAEVVVCDDSHGGLLAPALADRLGVPHLCGVVAAELRDGKVVASRPAGGRLLLMAASPPLVLGVVTAAAAPAAGRGEASGEVDRLGLARIGVAPAELRWRRRFAPSRLEAAEPPQPPRPLRFPDARSLVERLRAEGLLLRPGEARGR